MEKPKYEGKCEICRETFSRSSINRHIKTCLNKDERKKREKNFLYIFVKADIDPLFWLCLLVEESVTLQSLDSFLREIWLECCGHLSSFKIQNIIYNNEMDNHSSFGLTNQIENYDMNHPLKEVINVNTTFSHTYDFGSSTELILKLIFEIKGSPFNKDIFLVARNILPKVVCLICKKKANFICQQCKWEGYAFYCEKCGEQHECGEEMLIPVVNSPRMGVCGYTGKIPLT